MKAHDNPSPPPGSSRSSLANPEYRRSVTPLDPPPLPSNDMQTIDQGLDSLSVQPTPPTTGSREIQRSLLSFDSPLTSPTVTPPTDSPPTSPSHLPITNSHPSVDDLLSLSPGPYPSAYNSMSRSASPPASAPGFEQLVGENPRVTYASTSESKTNSTGDATVSLEQPSTGSPRLRSPRVLLIEALQEMTARGSIIYNQGKDPTSTDDAENLPAKWNEDSLFQDDYLSDDNSSRHDGKVGPITKRSTRDTPSADHELGSLSPTSTNLLTRLLSSPPKTVSGPALDITQNNNSGLASIVEETNPQPPEQHPLSLPQLPKTPTPDPPIRAMNLVRFSNPTPSSEPQSPAKGRLHPVALDDPQRTPARRIPIDEAIVQGRVSPHKDATFVGRIPVFKIPPTDSPARRVNADQVIAPRPGLRFGSPTRGASPAKHRTADSGISSYKNKDMYAMKDLSSKARIPGSSSAFTGSKPRPLPFPIIASGAGPSKPNLDPKPMTGDAADLRMNSPIKSDSPPMSSPAKSSLKQTTSKIPRGIKPYSRPAVHSDKSTSTTVRLAKARTVVCLTPTCPFLCLTSPYL